MSEELRYFIYLQMFGSGHIKYFLLPDPQQDKFLMHPVMCQANLSIYRLMIAALIKTYLNMCILFSDLLPRKCWLLVEQPVGATSNGSGFEEDEKVAPS